MGRCSLWRIVGTWSVSTTCSTEVAYPGLEVDGKRAVPVANGEKGAYWSILKATGSPGHGSAPHGTDNALHKMAIAISGLDADTVPGRGRPRTGSYSWAASGWARNRSNAFATSISSTTRSTGLRISDPALARYIHAATHLTISSNVLHAGTKTNVVADRAHAEIDIRGLAGMDREFVDSHLRKAMGSASDHVEIVPVMDGKATISATGNHLWAAIADAVEELDGHRNLVPTLTTVATDARFWRARGTVAYGVGLFDDRMTFSEMTTLFHGHDERVSVESVARTTGLYERALERFFTE